MTEAAASKLEQVAQAIYELRFGDLDMDKARDMARAAIGAMLVPTAEAATELYEAMIIGGHEMKIQEFCEFLATYQALVDRANEMLKARFER